jgi:H+/Cl- antiporter ClcA/CBS domain-containing protein
MISEPHVVQEGTTEGLPVAPGMGEALREAHVPHQATLVDARVLLISALAVLIGFAAAFIARGLMLLIALVTNLSFYGNWSMATTSPAGHHLGFWVLLPPVIGGLIVGYMARYGTAAIRGHGIPEAMEQVLLNQSRISPRVLFWKPISSAIAIGTGGPFGAEGPIIATGGALGSLIGQILRTTAVERKTLLAAGAAAGMAATFGSPVAAVILAVELLLFEFRPRSIIPVTLASVTATGMRFALVGTEQAFPMPHVNSPSGEALAFYVLMGALFGVFSVGITRLVYLIEDLFEELPIHWMWWPAIGGVVVGVVGIFAPHTLGVGYDNIQNLIGGSVVGKAALFLCLMKLLSWAVALGSGTSGGTLAPIFTIGSGLGSVIGAGAIALMPGAGIDIRIAALVGMAALFAGASRALLASVVFAFETTLQPMGLLPLLGGCTASYLVSCLLMKNTIMTEKIERRGVRVPAEYSADFLEQVAVRDVAAQPVVTLNATQTLAEVRQWLAHHSSASHHQGYPVLDEREQLIGVVTRRNILDGDHTEESLVRDLIQRSPAVVFEDSSLREAADHMVRERVGRLPVVSHTHPRTVVSIITRSDLLAAHTRRLEEVHVKQRSIRRKRSQLNRRDPETPRTA